MDGTVFHIQRFSLFDGPGVRTVVFLKGCPLRCIWCHNPEGQLPQPQLMVQPEKCIACENCVCACPNGCHRFENGVHHFDRSRCTGCGRCAERCFTGALSLVGKRMRAQDVMREVLRDRKMYEESGGGLTLSGGEPLAQPDFAIELLRLAKQENLSTCIETSGQAEPSVLQKAAAYTDLFLYDYKTEKDDHKRLCGMEQDLILSNLSLLDRLRSRVVLRCPIIPYCNNDDAHIDGIGQLAKAHVCIEAVQLEPYHDLGVPKSEQLGISEPFLSHPPKKDALERACKRIYSICQKETSIS